MQVNSIQAVGRWLGLDRRAVRYALSLFFAASIAFAIASVFHVQNAYWAAMPVWVVAQAQRGLMLERAVFRVLGTLIGSAVGFAILQFIHEPVIALAVLSIWIAFSGGLTHMLRRAGSYAALMAGMTAAVVVLPLLLSPGQSLELALARVECTLIGVIVVTLVTGVFTPNSQRDDFYARVQTLAAEVVAYVAHMLRNDEHGQFERRVLAEISAVETAADSALAGSIDGYRRIHHVNALVAASLALMAAGQILKRRRDSPEWKGDEDVPRQLAGFADKMRTDRPLNGMHDDLKKIMLSARLENTRLAAALEQLVDAAVAVTSGTGTKKRPFGQNSITLAPRYEWSLARRTGLVCGGATFLAAVSGLISGWSAGELAALGVCIFSMVLGSMPKPQVIAPFMFKGLIVGVIVATFYRFVIAPHVATVPELILSVMPFIFVGAFARAGRKTAMVALDANMCFMLAGQAVLPIVTDSAAILNGALAILVAGTIVTTGFRLVPRHSAPLVSDAARVIVSDLQRLIQGTKARKNEDWQPRALRQTLRMMLHLGRASDLRETAPESMLAVLNLGNAVIDIRAMSRQAEISVWSSQVLEDALDALAYFADDVPGTVSKLETLAEDVKNDQAAMALRDAAHALTEGRRLFELKRTIL